MSDYKEKLDELHQAARRRVRELDEKFAIKDLVEEGTRVATNAAKRGADTVVSSAERVRAEAERLAEDGSVRETTERVARDAAEGARKAGEVLRDVAGSRRQEGWQCF